MDDDKDMESSNFTSETVGLLILNELRLMRRDMKLGITRLETKVDLVLSKKAESGSIDLISIEAKDEVEETSENSSPNYINKDQMENRAKKKSISEDEKILATDKEPIEVKEESANGRTTVHIDLNELPDDEEDYFYTFYDEDEDQGTGGYGRYTKPKIVIEDEPMEKFIVPLVANEKGRYQCDRCPNSYTMKGNLRRHYRHHLNDKRFQCLICKRRFYRNEYLLRHMRQHEEDGDVDTKDMSGNQYTCSTCNKSFSAAINLKRHMRAHTTDRPKPYPCNQCDEKFTRDTFLKRHIRKVHSVK